MRVHVCACECMVCVCAYTCMLACECQWRIYDFRKGGASLWAKPTLARKRPIVGGSGGMPPRNVLKNGCSEMRFLAFWDTILTVTEPP